MLKDMEKERLSQESSLIQDLTNDEDQRQDLWVYYLSGNSSSSFASHLQKIQSQNIEYYELQTLIWNFVNDAAYPRIMELIGDFSEFERSLIIMLVMGL